MTSKAWGVVLPVIGMVLYLVVLNYAYYIIHTSYILPFTRVAVKTLWLEQSTTVPYYISNQGTFWNLFFQRRNHTNFCSEAISMTISGKRGKHHTKNGYYEKNWFQALFFSSISSFSINQYNENDCHDLYFLYCHLC